MFRICWKTFVNFIVVTLIERSKVVSSSTGSWLLPHCYDWIRDRIFPTSYRIKKLRRFKKKTKNERFYLFYLCLQIDLSLGKNQTNWKVQLFLFSPQSWGRFLAEQSFLSRQINQIFISTELQWVNGKRLFKTRLKTERDVCFHTGIAYWKETRVENN